MLCADYHVNRRLSKKPLLKPKMLIVDLFVTAKEKISVATTRYEMWQKSQDLSHCDFFVFSGENEWIVAALFKVSLPYHFFRSFTISQCSISQTFVVILIPNWIRSWFYARGYARWNRDCIRWISIGIVH